MDVAREWLEADGLGGFASGTPGLVRTRRYHALLLAAAKPPVERYVLVNGLEVWVQTPTGRWALSAHRYGGGAGVVGGVMHPDGNTRITSFTHEPWPTWIFALPDGTRVRYELVVPRGSPVVCLRWSLPEPGANVTLRVRPLISGRDYHALHRENGNFAAEACVHGQGAGGGAVEWRPYHDATPHIWASHSGVYQPGLVWYRNFWYAEEAARGMEACEDLASPGEIVMPLNGAAYLALGATTPGAPEIPSEAAGYVNGVFDRERDRRAGLGTGLARAADAYLVKRGEGRTIVAGYPWFTDWGRDTFIALRGLCLATGRLEEAGKIVLEWAGAVDQGMLPNRFADSGQTPEFNAADASLWFVVAAQEWLTLARASARDKARVQDAILAIVRGYTAGTRFGIRREADGLLHAGAQGQQLTWMDAKIGDWVVTPRAGKPVELQALWINALRIAGEIDRAFVAAARQAQESFEKRFWNASAGCLFDVVDSEDVDVPGRAMNVEFMDDPRLRPNQLFAIGGLPYQVLSGEKAARVVQVCEKELWTPMGPRTLGPSEPNYRARYAGGPLERDGAYHQGTAWPWLAGAFIEAWVRVKGGTPQAKREAREKFFEPLMANVSRLGLGHLAEVAEGDAPHAPGGCPFQAWSVGEAIRLDRVVLA
ncbi:MAG: glycogen debranching protein [Tepidisphaera sp.]|nr:glycogen debranching protein [Tepidisphaera sp.]